MKSEKKKIDDLDPQRISKSEDYELQEWSKKFGVSPEELKKAIERAGLNAKTAKTFFKKRRKNEEENI